MQFSRCSRIFNVLDIMFTVSFSTLNWCNGTWRNVSEEEFCNLCLQIPIAMVQLPRIPWKLYGMFVTMIHSPLTELLKKPHGWYLVLPCSVPAISAILSARNIFGGHRLTIITAQCWELYKFDSNWRLIYFW